MNDPYAAGGFLIAVLGFIILLLWLAREIRK